MTLAASPLSRRRFLQGSAAACLAGATIPALHPRLAFATPGDSSSGDTLVVVILRGGMDGLSAVVPAGEHAYYARRGSIAVPADKVIGLDDRFGLHPVMAPLAEVYQAGDLALVPAFGSPDPSRSHFDQQDLLERGVPRQDPSRTGWVGRYLSTRAPAAPTVQGFAIGSRVPSSMLGAPAPVAVPELTTFSLADVSAAATAGTHATLTRLAGDGPLAGAATMALETLDLLAATNPTAIKPANGASYGTLYWGYQLKQVAQLIRANVGLQAAALDFNGWDTHTHMGTYLDGTMRTLLESLSLSLHAFYVDLLDVRTQVTTVVLSEFGRRVTPNGNGGCDHGHGGVAMVMGGGIRGGVYGAWPGLDDSSLDRGDVAVTTDFRSVLAEVVQQRLRTDPAAVFPGFTPAPLGLSDPA